MAIRAQRRTVDPRVRQRIDDLIAAAAEQLRHDRGRRDSNEQHVIEADAVEAVLEREATLNLVRFDHRGQHVAHHERLLAGGHVRAADVVRDRENAAEVVGRMSPLGGEPRVVEVEPANHAADVPCRFHRIELELRARHARSVQHRRSADDRAEVLAALRETAARGIHIPTYRSDSCAPCRRLRCS